MIILPDSRIPRTRILMPVPKHEWMPPSQAQQKTFCGDEDRTLFRIRAMCNDGHVVWSGWFESREDADAFFYAAITGSLSVERELWRLPMPEWHPGIDVDIVYNFATFVFLTATSSSSYSTPSDWNNANNKIHCIGGGGSGGSANRQSSVVSGSSGGGGGGYGIYTNLTMSGSITYQCGTGGTAVNRTTAGATAGNAGAASASMPSTAVTERFSMRPSSKTTRGFMFCSVASPHVPSRAQDPLVEPPGALTDRGRGPGAGSSSCISHVWQGPEGFLQALQVFCCHYRHQIRGRDVCVGGLVQGLLQPLLPVDPRCGGRFAAATAACPPPPVTARSAACGRSHAPY
jgi:hypothetical protein